MVKTKKTLASLFVLLFIISCNSVNKIRNITSDDITIESTECGSYKVKNNDVLIGYAVKPFVLEVDRVNEITDFEHKLKIKYRNKFTDDYRVYSFTTDRAGDTILNTIFLIQKHTKNILNWNCELQEVDIYWKKKNAFFKHKEPRWVTYNCSKNRFKVSGDPD